uniref:hypothetical protein n=1 Tax=Streptococcus agalactiae TaxID=1311 RepID=UPI0030ECC789
MSVENRHSPRLAPVVPAQVHGRQRQVASGLPNALLALALGSLSIHAEVLSPEHVEFFEKKIRPVLV